MQYPQKNTTILVVEDDLYLRDSLKFLLESSLPAFQPKVMVAENGQAALNLLPNLSPDLILSDISMPKIDGYELMRRVRQNSQWLHIPFIYLTAHASKKEMKRGRLSGVEQYIAKPVDPNRLIELVEAQLIRERQLTEMREETLTQLKQHTIQTLNHEFRTALTLVTVYYEMLANGLDWDAAEHSAAYLEGIQTGCAWLTQLTEGLLEAVELRTGELEARFNADAAYQSGGNVMKWWREAGATHQQFADDHGIEIVWLLPKKLPALRTAPWAVKSLADKIISNAVKFTAYRQDQAGRVAISIAGNDDEISFKVIDNGIGIHPNALPRVFELFYQEERDRYEQQGAGSGLSIAQALTQFHHGKINITSPKNGGAEVIITLPTDYKANQSVQVAPSQNQPVTVLVVDDEPALRDALVNLIEVANHPDYQFKAVSATDGEDALKVLEKITPHIIISDIMMPKIDGYELLAAVRQEKKWAHIPFIFLTAKGSDDEIHKGRTLGVEEYITKPYNLAEIIDALTIKLERANQIQSTVFQGFSAFKEQLLILLNREFHSPIHALNLYSESLADRLNRLESEAEMKETLGGLKEASQRFSLMVEDFISLAEVKAGAAQDLVQANQTEIGQPHRFFEQIIEQSLEFPAISNMNVTFKLWQPTAPIDGDLESLETAGQRFIYSCALMCQLQGQNELLISCRQLAGELQLEIEMPNIAIVDDEMSHIQHIIKLQPNAGVQTDYSAPLNVAAQILHLHDGRLEVKNEDFPQKMVTATLYLPAKAVPALA